MNYTIVLFNKKELEVSEDELKRIINAPDNELVHIKRLGMGFNKKGIAHYEPTESKLADERKNNKIGILHDGSRVIRYFGVWYLDGEFHEEGGRIIPSKRIDPQYYPEVSKDVVFTPNEYEEVKHLSKGEILKLMVGNINETKRRLGGGFKQLKEITNESK